jgi:hypothetical protein
LSKIRAVILDPEKDNIAVALADLKAGETITLKSGPVELKENISYQHKFSIRDIGMDENIIKVGETIGKSTAKIQSGCHVHVHNMKGLRARKGI